MDEDLAADRGNFDALVGALEQRDAEFVFELADLAAEGRLADIADLGRTAKMAVFGDGDQVAEFLKVHGSPG